MRIEPSMGAASTFTLHPCRSAPPACSVRANAPTDRRRRLELTLLPDAEGRMLKAARMPARPAVSGPDRAFRQEWFIFAVCPAVLVLVLRRSNLVFQDMFKKLLIQLEFDDAR